MKYYKLSTRGSLQDSLCILANNPEGIDRRQYLKSGIRMGEYFPEDRSH